MRGVYEWKLSEKSKKANAALTGHGLDPPHHSFRHASASTIPTMRSKPSSPTNSGTTCIATFSKSIFMQVGITFFGFWLVNQVLRFVIARNWFPVLDPRLYDFRQPAADRAGGDHSGFLLMPALNAISRRHEREADRYAWENISAIGPFITSMQKLADQNLAERDAVQASSSGSSTRIRPSASGSPPPSPGRASSQQSRSSVAYLDLAWRSIASTRRKSSSVSTPTVSNGVSATWIAMP